MIRSRPLLICRSIYHGIKSDSVSPHCTSTCRIVTSLTTVRSGTSQRTMGIVTNHGMPVRWSTAHYRFSRAPCTATLYRRPSLARSFTSFCLCSSQSTSLALSPKFPSSFHQPRFLHALSLLLSVTVTPSHSCGCRFSLAHTLPPEYYVLTERSQCRIPPCPSYTIPLLVR